MGYISSTCTSLTPITNTNGQWSATDVSFQFHDPHGSSFTLTHGSGSSGYQGLRTCLLYTSPSPRDLSTSRMPSSA